MGRNNVINWEAAERDYIERRATGETITWAGYAEELGCTRNTVMRHAKDRQWEEKAEARTEELTEKVWEHLEIDQVAVRKALLQPFLAYARAQSRLARLYDDVIIEILGDDDMTPMERLQRIEDLPSKGLRLLQQITVSLAEVGGGLPKYHSVSVDDHHDEIVANRRQMQSMEAKVKELREWARARRRGPYAGEVQDAEIVEPKAIPTGRKRPKK